MSCHDTVKINCPKCHKDIIAFSKKGPCAVESFELSNAPLAILADLEHQVFVCENCKTKCHLSIQKLVGVQPYII